MTFENCEPTYQNVFIHIFKWMSILAAYTYISSVVHSNLEAQNIKKKKVNKKDPHVSKINPLKQNSLWGQVGNILWICQDTLCFCSQCFDTSVIKLAVFFTQESETTQKWFIMYSWPSFCTMIPVQPWTINKADTWITSRMTKWSRLHIKHTLNTQNQSIWDSLL